MKRNLAREKSRKARRKAKRTIIPFPKLLKEADSVFSKWIRKRDDWTCIVCGTKENIQNGHLIPRGNKAVRFSETNCNALCGSCNWRDRFWHHHYEIAWLRKWGVLPMFDLNEKANEKKKLSRQDLEQIIRKYSHSQSS